MNAVLAANPSTFTYDYEYYERRICAFSALRQSAAIAFSIWRVQKKFKCLLVAEKDVIYSSENLCPMFSRDNAFLNNMRRWRQKNI